MASRTTLFPLYENEILLTPPEIFAPGHVALICLVASIKLIAYSLCSSIPVATAKILGSKMMS